MKLILTTIKGSIAIALSVFLSSCLMLMVTGPTQFENTPPHPLKKAEERLNTLIPRSYTMRGFLDIFSTGMNSLANKIHEQLGMQATSLSHLEARKLSQFLIKEYQSGRFKGPIILIGHSYGADDQITVAKQLNEAHVPVDLIITLDNTKTQTIPQNVRKLYNINSGKSIFSGIIPWGIPMQAQSKQTKVVNIDLIKDKGIRGVNHLNIDKLPAVQQYIIEVIKSEVVLHPKIMP